MNPLSGSDWEEVFKYAASPNRVMGATCEESGFSIEDVETVLFTLDGDNDGPDWVCAGQLKDGRWFVISAGCDYTGWGCQEGGDSWVADDLEQLEQFGYTHDIRSRLAGSEQE